MLYKTDIDKVFLNYLVGLFEANLYDMEIDNFDKRCSVTEKGGRPYSYSPREICEQMVIYFRNCVKYEQPFMISGICLQLGISRMGLLNLEKSSRSEFVDTIKKGKSMVGMYLEMQGCLLPNPSFPIFLLKSMGWTDKKTIIKIPDIGISEKERVEAQERINNFSEIIN